MSITFLSLLLLLLLTLLSYSSTTARDTITPSTPLAGNDTLVSSGGHFALGFFYPSNSNSRYIGIWYNQIPVQTVVWVANRDTPITTTPDTNTTTLSITSNGTLIISTSNGTTLWSSTASALSSVTNPTAQLLDTGNFVIRDTSSTSTEDPAWQSFDHPTDTLLPGMKFGVDLRTGLNRTLTSWTNASDPAPGPFLNFIDISGDPEVFVTNGPNKIWRSGAWDGVQFTGVPGMDTYSGFTFSFVNNKQEVTYSFEILNQSIVSRLVLNASGQLQRSVWVASAGAWNIFWYAPKDQCDAVSSCGPYGLCNPNGSPICSCLQGFLPKSPANWALRDGHDGCVRETQLDCAHGSDGFLKVSHAKTPDSTNATVDLGVGDLEQCRERCLKNCSCTAYASANVSGGGDGGTGCVIWSSELTDMSVYTNFGQDLYVRLAAANLGSPPGQSMSDGARIAVILSVSVAMALLAFVGFVIWRRKKAKKPRPDTPKAVPFSNELRRHHQTSTDGEDLELPLFDLETIEGATGGFSVENKLGEGGFGPVYKGQLANKQEIAVKRLAKTSVQGFDEFKNEVMLIAKLQHRNLVRLLGCCVYGEEKMLIYEYMPNKSLDAFLFDKSKGVLLDWQTRYRIIEGIARGLLYLHQDSRYRVIHRDLKASNVLLDKDMDPKISDFGMARIFGGDETELNTRKVVGTYGYMSPEYAMDGVFSVKSDVFSFGVLVLEIITGRRNRGVYSYSNHLNLLAHAWSLRNEGKSLQLVDESMNYSYNKDEVLKCVKLGLLCVQENPEDRPLMSSVIVMLGSDGTSLPDPKMPGFATRRIALETESSSSKPDSAVWDNMTVTIIEGR